MPVSLGPAYVAPEIYITSSPAAAAYQRPIDWLDMPPMTIADDKVAFLVAVYNTGSPTYMALRFSANSGTITYDWGDGSVPEIVTSGDQAVHAYNFDDLSAGSLTTSGFRQVVCVVTATTGNLTVMDLDETPAGYSGATFNNPFIGLKSSTPSLNTLTTKLTHYSCEEIEILNFGNVKSLSQLCRFWYSLKKAVFNLAGITNAYLLTQSAPLVEFQATNAESVSVLANAFQYSKLKKLDLSGFNSVTTYFALLDLAVAPDELIMDCSSCTNTGSFLPASGKLSKLIMTNLAVSTNVSNQMLGAPALNAFFTACAADLTGVTLTVTGNPGASTCDTSIVTARGGSVVT